MKENTETGQIIMVDFNDEFKKSYIDYSMSVITSRAIPDARDGLKPVQRRLLFDMNELGVWNDKPTKKCARIVGDTMGKYHPHGDSSIYEALVVLTQPFKKMVPLIYGQGNLGSIEGDGAAAQRYTEAKLEIFSKEVLLSDLEQTVPFVKNYDGTETEPKVLPARLPLLLINGSEGIAVGMTTSIPTHNVGEVCDVCMAFIDNPESSTKELLKHLQGPDFPTGGIIANKHCLNDIYETGSGKIRVRGTIKYEKANTRKESDHLVITEIPYTMVGSGIERFMMDIASLVEAKTLPDITDIYNQSGKEGLRIVLDVKKNADIERIKNILYKKTKLEDTFGVNMLAIHEGKPVILPLKDILSIWHSFQKSILKNKYTALIDKCFQKKEIQEGLLNACGCIDLIIEVIRGSKNINEAKECLISGNTEKISFKTKASKTRASKLSFTEAQADAILRMQLQKLIGLEIGLLEKDYCSTLKLINEYSVILNEEKKLDEVIKKDLADFKKQFSAKRKTKLLNCSDAVYEETKEVINGYVLIDKFRYCKLIDLDTYERNKDAIESQYPFYIRTRSDSKIFIFSDSGQLYQIKCEKIPYRKFKDKGEPLENLCGIQSSYNIIFVSPYEEIVAKYILVTKNGYIKAVDSSEYMTVKRDIQSTKLTVGDSIIKIIPLKNEKYLILRNRNGKILKISVSEVPLLKKNSIGVKGMDLKDSELEDAFLVNNTDSFILNDSEIKVSTIKASKRGGTGYQKKEG